MAAPPAELIPLGRALPLRVYLRSLWQRREFAISVPLGELRAQHMNTALGQLWHLLNPLLLFGVYFLIFGLLLNTRRGVDNFVPYLAIGVFVFSYSQRAVVAGAGTIVANEGLIRSLAFPRAVLPIAAVVRETIAFVPALVLMVAITLLTGERLTLDWLLLPAALGLHVMFNLGAAFLVARLTTAFRDVQNLLPFVFRILFYLSGVLYSFAAFVPERFAHLLGWTALNPFYALISLYRQALMSSYELDPLIAPWVWPSALLWAPLLLVAGFLYFRAGEATYGRG